MSWDVLCPALPALILETSDMASSSGMVSKDGALNDREEFEEEEAKAFMDPRESMVEFMRA